MVRNVFALTSALVFTSALALGLSATPAEAQLTIRQMSIVRMGVQPVRTPTVYTNRMTLTTLRIPAPPPPAPAAPGTLACAVTENGAYAPANLELRLQGRVIATSDCSAAISVPEGSYYATVTLRGALDRPQQTVPVTVRAGRLATASAAFSTATLEVRFTKDRQAVYGLAIVRRDGVDLGSLGSRITARLTPGRYEIVTRYRTETRTYTVDLAPGQVRALRADF